MRIGKSLYYIGRIIQKFANLIDRFGTDLEFYCMDCAKNTLKSGDYYMLKDEVWLSIVKDHTGMLCLNCVENRLGRILNTNDFTDAIINQIVSDVSNHRKLQSV